MDIRTYEYLHAVPLFQGLNGVDLHRILDRPHVSFSLLSKGETIGTQGERCEALTILLRGEIEVKTTSPDGLYYVRQRIIAKPTAPLVLEPEACYGLRRTWRSTYTCTNECHLLTIGKSDLTFIINAMEVARINYINTLATIAQKRTEAMWTDPCITLKGRVLQFLRQHTSPNATDVEFWIKKTDLAILIGGCTRALISKVLRQLQDEGQLTLGRNAIRLTT